MAPLPEMQLAQASTAKPAFTPLVMVPAKSEFPINLTTLG